MTSFSERVWAAETPMRAAIDDLPFVRGLGAGTLDRDRFTYYMAQDAHYLDGYARALSTAAATAGCTDDLAFWAKSAYDVAVVERDLHRAYVDDIARHPRSPTCVGYASYLLGVAHTQGYPELVAALLPCFWVYQDVGARMLAATDDLDAHPYADWIRTYADPSFAAATLKAREIVDRTAASAGPATLARMGESFAQATRWEWAFWDAAWRRESWAL